MNSQQTVDLLIAALVAFLGAFILEPVLRM